MIQFLSNWIEQIAIAVIIVSVIELILPEGNLKKYIKVVLGIYVVFCIISPFVNSSSLYNFDKGIDKYVDDIANNNRTVNQESMDKRLKQLYIDELKNNISKKAEEYGYQVQKCNIDADLNMESDNPGIHKMDLVVSQKQKGISNIEKVDISIAETNKEPEIESEQIENLKQELANYYEVDKNIIVIKTK